MRRARTATRPGDAGWTSLGGGRRVRKTHPLVAALGAIDELSCVLGVAGPQVPRRMRPLLESVQLDLFDVGADVAAGLQAAGGRAAPRVTVASVIRIEAEAARRLRRLPPLRGFVVPGGSAGAGWLHLARAVCRRAELALWVAGPRGRVAPGALGYLNRLSGLLFVLARTAGGRPRPWSPRPS